MKKTLCYIALILATISAHAQDTTIADYATATPVTGDLIYFLDISDTTDGEDGSNKKLTLSNLITWRGLAPSANGQSLVVAANYAAMRTLLDLEAGTDFYSISAADAAFQALDADLTTYAGITPSANVQAFLGGANYAALRTLLDLEAGTDFYSISAADAAFQAIDADLDIYAGITPSANVQALLAGANYAALRTLLDLEAGTDFYSISAADAAFQPLDSDLTTFAGITPSANAQALLAAANYAAMRSQLNVEDGATGDQTGAEIKTAYESQTDTNEFSDAEQTKLAGIEASAEANPAQASGGELTAGTETGLRSFSPADIKSAIDTHGSGGAPEGTDVLSTGESGGSKFLREDGDGTSSWQEVPGGGNALTGSPLSQFAATTSAQLAGVLSDETGTGAFVLAASPTLSGTINLGAVDIEDDSGDLVLTAPTGSTLTLPASGNIRFDRFSTTIFQSTSAGGARMQWGVTVAPFVANDNAIDLGTSTARWRTAYMGTSIELGHASDTTLARSSAGVVTIEGATIQTGPDDDVPESGDFGDASALEADGSLSGDVVGASNIVDDAIDSEHYAAGSIDNEHLADDAVDSDEIATGAVGADALDGTGVEAELEGVLDLNQLQGAVTDAQVPDDITLSATSTKPVYTQKHSASHTISANECYGGVHYATAAATVTLPAAAAGMSVTIITVGAVAVSVDPNASDLIVLDGVTLDDGDKATNLSTSGDIITLTYYDATGWYGASNAWTDGGP